ncbi:LacI family transcriptional regulator [Erwinia endophytica]|uniref:LacI family DNA-binding transcriptional regulator n=1 Tax=Erwinia endophytica TaxID=1563158 RepID=UPI001265E212|nr:LacI family DNA-binding transcriptional regulator [Erwinia endophytica]KAB8312869.1 LacI family transcriptional regulator [Erwinia endophytica]
MKTMTLDELARVSGVSVATVDRVLNERGGVSPRTTKKVLQAAREAGLKRILPEEHRQPWQIEVMLSGNDSFFFKQLASDFATVATALGYRRIVLHRTFIPESRPDKLAAHIIASSQRCDGLIVFAHEHPAIYDALSVCKRRGVPVVTLVTDLPGAERLCHVGINQLQAGRTAGLMMGNFLKREGEVIMVSGRFEYSAHQQRIQGFRDVLHERFPHLVLKEALAGQESRNTISKLLEKQLVQSKTVVGVYNTGLGNTQVSEALARHRLTDSCILITHELYATTRALFAKGTLALTLDQNTRRHAQLSVDMLLRYLEKGVVPAAQDGKVKFMLYTAENYH